MSTPAPLTTFIKVDGYIKNSANNSDTGLGGMLGGILGGGANKKKPSEEWVPCTRWVRKSRIEEIIYEALDVKLSVAPPSPRPMRRAQAPQYAVRAPPAQLDRFYDAFEALEQIGGGADGQGPQLAPPAPAGVEQPLPPGVVDVFAPAGWWIYTGQFPGGTLYHVANYSDGELLSQELDESETAKAINRLGKGHAAPLNPLLFIYLFILIFFLADEIALKPSNMSGSEVLNAQSRFYA